MSIAVLAGGKSSRMGTDKALLRLAEGGPTLLEAIAASVEALADDLMLIGPPERGYGALLPGWRIVADALPGAGPAGGLITALREARGDRVLVLPCDAAHVARPLVRSLLELCTGDAPVVPWRPGVSRQGVGRTLEVLHGVYPVSALPAFEQMLAQGEQRLFRMVAHLDPVLKGPDWLTRFDPGLLTFRSLNTPDDVDVARGDLFAHRNQGIY